MPLGLLLSALTFFIGIPLLTVGIGYLALRGHLHEIPLRRSGAVAMSAFVAMALAAARLTPGTVGYVIGQILGNGNVGLGLMPSRH